MAATQGDIKNWLERGKEQGATHMIVVCDTFDYDDYPVFVTPGDDPQEKVEQARGPMQRVMEVYDLSLDFDTQLDPDKRVWNL